VPEILEVVSASIFRDLGRGDRNLVEVLGAYFIRAGKLTCQHPYPGIAECGAVAVPAEQGEDEVKVAVVLDADTSFDPEDLISFLISRMPRFAIPRFIEVWESLPKTEATARI